MEPASGVFDDAQSLEEASGEPARDAHVCSS
jgi:hypothetical protein